MMIAKETIAAKSDKLKAYVERLTELLTQAVEEGTPLHEFEEKTLRVLLEMGRVNMQILFDVCGPGDAGSAVELPDGRTVQRLPKPHGRSYVSIFGEFALTRYVYGRGEGRKIECVPLDARLALPESKFSYLLQDWDQSLAMEEPFAQASAVVEKILGLSQHVDSLERTNRQMARLVGDFHAEQTAPPPEEEGAVLVQTADGKGVPIRRPAHAPPIETHQSQRGPKPGGKKMAVLGAVYSIDPHVRTPEEVVTSLFRQPSKPRQKTVRPRPQHKRIRASLDHTDVHGDPVNGPAAIFGWIAEEVATRNPHGHKPLVSIMDGQESLWNQSEVFQEDVPRTEVLDLLHVTPRLWEAAQLFRPTDSRSAEQFVRDRVLRILRGEVASVIRGLRRLATTKTLRGKRREKLETICGYFKKNRARMQYDVYLAAGYPIASGVIEGACRHVVKDRLERTGMTWTIPGAQAMLELRCVHLSRAWQPFTQFRVQRETERLYPYRAITENSMALVT